MGAGIFNLRRAATDHYLATQHYEARYYLPPPPWLRVFSLGHDEAVADLLWCRALIYFGDEIRHQGDVRHIYHYAEAMLALDPEFRRVYRWAGMGAMYRTGGVTPDDIRGAIAFLEQGVTRFPDDGDLQWDLGAAYNFELAPLIHDPDEKQRLKDRGVEHLQIAARLGAGPAWLVLTNATQLRELGRTEQAIRHLEEMYATIDDPDTKQQIEWQLEALRSHAHAEALRRTYEDLEARRLHDFPYVPAELFLHLGNRPPVDRYGAMARWFLPEGRTMGDAPNAEADDRTAAPADGGQAGEGTGPLDGGAGALDASAE